MTGATDSLTPPARSPARPRRARAWLRRYGPAVLVAAIGAGFTCVAGMYAAKLERDRLGSEFERLAQDRVSAVIDAIQDNLHGLQALSAFFDADREAGWSAFRTFAAAIMTGNSGIQALEWIPRVPAAARETYEQAARDDGLATFQITELGPEGELVRAARRDEYFPVFYVEPLQGNERALGFDLASSVSRAEALAQARDSGRMTVTAPLRLVQEKGDQYGVLVFIPEYQTPVTPDAVEQRREALTGFVLGVYRLGDLLEACIAPLKPVGIDIGLIDKTTPSGERVLWYHPSRIGPPGTTEARPEAHAAGLVSSETCFDVGGRVWGLRCSPAPAFYARPARGYPWIARGAGALCTFLLTSYVVQAARYTTRVEGQVAARTCVLLETNAALRESEEKYRALVETTGTGFVIIDERGTVLDANAEYVRLSGHQELREILGRCVTEWTAAHDRERNRQEVQQCFGHGSVRNLEIDYVDQQGKTTPIEINATVVQAVNGTQVLTLCRDITGRKRMEGALRASEDKYRSLVANIPDVIWTSDDQGNSTFISPNVARLYGYTPEEICAAGDRLWFGRMHPDDVAHVQEAYRALFAGAPFDVEYQIQRKDGQWIWVHDRAVTRYQKDGAAYTDGMFTDITERKRMEGELRESERRHRAITETAQDAIITSDDQGQVQFWNCAAERIFGYSAPDAIGKNILDLIVPPQYQEAKRRGLAEFARTGTGPVVGKTVEVSALRKDGTEIPVEVSVSGYRDRQGMHGVAVIRDISERKRAESKLAALQQQLLDASRQAGMAEVASGVLHNVGNVLNSLNVSATLVADKVRTSRVTRLSQVAELLRTHAADWATFTATDEKGRRLPGYLIQLAEHLAAEQATVLNELDVLVKSVEHVKSIINMQSAAADYARSPAIVEETSVADLLDEVLQMNVASFAHHHIQVQREYRDAPTVLADKHTVLQVLVNLVRNAKQALCQSDQADKRLNVRVAPGDPGAPGQYLRIEVRDNGVGIPAENLTRIWEYGFTTKEDGHGLGLHNSALAAKAIGGSLEVYSAGPGQGATFIFQIPMQVGAANHV
jgi:PAS domain S-box-containing protein